MPLTRMSLTRLAPASAMKNRYLANTVVVQQDMMILPVLAPQREKVERNKDCLCRALQSVTVPAVALLS